MPFFAASARFGQQPQSIQRLDGEFSLQSAQENSIEDRIRRYLETNQKVNARESALKTEAAGGLATA
ncbi:hypothetical protein [uncultured Roseobacter sp.]|uniref:hypothetical protein n=1 Tax=uncultured Roseobacter sp. TaxID=114847 RepID=UPI00261E6C85|nr:hypothetical protein [uncultured Roseobacter sp.]